jgi:hypothetical protein
MMAADNTPSIPWTALVLIPTRVARTLVVRAAVRDKWAPG